MFSHTPVRTTLALLLTVLIVSSSIPVAAQTSPPWADGLQSDLNAMVGPYNENVDGLDLGLGDALLEDERITLRVTDAQGRVAYYNFETDGDKRIVTDVSAGEHPQTTLLMKSDRATMEGIATASDPVAAFRTAVEENRVTFEGTTATNWLLATGFTIARSILDAL